MSLLIFILTCIVSIVGIYTICSTVVVHLFMERPIQKEQYGMLTIFIVFSPLIVMFVIFVGIGLLIAKFLHKIAGDDDDDITNNNNKHFA
jgi:hypothetical protein